MPVMAEVPPEGLVPGDIIVGVRAENGCCDHLEVLVTVSRSPYNEEAS